MNSSLSFYLDILLITNHSCSTDSKCNRLCFLLHFLNNSISLFYFIDFVYFNSNFVLFHFWNFQSLFETGQDAFLTNLAFVLKVILFRLRECEAIFQACFVNVMVASMKLYCSVLIYYIHVT